MMAGVGTNLRVWQNMYRNHFFFVVVVLSVLGSTLGLQAFQPPVPGHPGSVRHFLQLFVCFLLAFFIGFIHFLQVFVCLFLKFFKEFIHFFIKLVLGSFSCVSAVLKYSGLAVVR